MNEKQIEDGDALESAGLVLFLLACGLLAVLALNSVSEGQLIEPAPDPGPVIVPSDAQCVNDPNYVWSHPIECGGNLPQTLGECVERLEREAVAHYSCGLTVFQLNDALAKERAKNKRGRK